MAFLVFEGIDGSGKTTLIKRLSKHLTQSGTPNIVTREPGGTPLGEEIREILIRKDGDIPVPRAELLLYETIRAQHVENVISPALAKGEWVLCDRFKASSIAFQAAGRGLPRNQIDWLNDFACKPIKVDLTVLLDLPVEVSMARRQTRNKEKNTTDDRFESEVREFHENVRQSYLEQVEENPKEWLTLEAQLSPDELFERLLAELRKNNWLES